MASKRTVKRKKPAEAQVPEQPKKSNKNTIIAVTAVIAIAVVFGAIASFINHKKTSSAGGSTVKIIDPLTKKSYDMKIEPASASMSPSGAEAAEQVQPVATKKTDFSYLYKASESKTVIPHITLEEAKYLFDSGKAVFVDARGDAQFNELHIKGAVSIPAGSEISRINSHEGKLKNAKVLVTYCHGVGCHLADKTAYLLYDAGYTRVVIFFGGWNQWMQAAYPVSK